MTTALRALEREYPPPPKASSPTMPTMPTMYDLPSEEVGQSGMPDLFHEWQARLLSETFQPPALEREEFFMASDMNLYYDDQNTRRYKRPDWFAVVGLPKEKHPGMRLSYVMWDEPAAPLVVAEFLSPSTQREDLGQVPRDVDGTPTKWDVYEKWARIPYYLIFGRLAEKVRIFKLENLRYVEIAMPEAQADGMVWMEEARLGLGVWHGSYLGEERLWLRWLDRTGNWVPTPAERAEQAREYGEQAREYAEQANQRAEQANQRADQDRLEKEAAQQRVQMLTAKLRALGIDPDQF